MAGKDPLINLSSAMSRDKRIRSVRYEGERMWWFADRALPSEGLLKEEAAEDDPAKDASAASEPNDEGR